LEFKNSLAFFSVAQLLPAEYQKGKRKEVPMVHGVELEIINKLLYSRHKPPYSLICMDILCLAEDKDPKKINNA
jgi:hypothetical protein